MSLSFHCPTPGCVNHRKTCRIPEAAAGRVIRCKQCGQTLTVVAPAAPPQHAEITPTSPYQGGEKTNLPLDKGGPTGVERSGSDCAKGTPGIGARYLIAAGAAGVAVLAGMVIWLGLSQSGSEAVAELPPPSAITDPLPPVPGTARHLPPASKPEVTPPVAQQVVPDELTKTRAEAKAAWAMVKDLDEGQGFKTQLQAIDNALTAAETCFVAKDYPQALQLYQSVVAKSGDVAALEAKRQLALKQAQLCQEAAAAVAASAAKTHASELWSAADQQQKAKELFEDGKFPAAGIAWAGAAATYAGIAKAVAAATPKDSNADSSTSPLPYEAADPSGVLAKVKVFQLKGKLKSDITGDIQPFTVAWHGNSKFVSIVQKNLQGQTFAFATVIHGDKGWSKVAGPVKAEPPTPLTGAILAEQRATELLFVVSNLAFLKSEEKEFNFIAAEAAKIKGQDCFAVKATRQGMPDMVFYFDKKTRLLAKVHAEFEFLQKLRSFDFYYSDYRDSNGVLHWRKREMYMDGLRTSQFDVDSIQLLKELDEKWFSFK